MDMAFHLVLTWKRLTYENDYLLEAFHLFWSCVGFLHCQYRIPDAYDQEGGVNQEKRFSVASQRYRFILRQPLTFMIVNRLLSH